MRLAAVLPAAARALAAVAAAAAVTLTAAPPARAGVTVEIVPGPGQEFAQKAGIDLSVIQQQLSGELDKLFQTSRLGDYLRSFGDAQSFTTKGMGVDYASDFSLLMVGIAANLSLNVEKGYVPRDTRTAPPVNGVSTTATLMGGVNLGWLGFESLNLYANYFKSQPDYGEFKADVDNLGVHAQLRLFRPGGEGLLDAVVRWGGLAVTSGFERARLRLALGKSFRRDIPVGDLGSEKAKVSIDSTGSFDVDMETLSVPLEVTTSLRFLYVASVYGGVGFDWQLGGGTDMKVGLTGTMTGEAAGQRTEIGTARITAEDHADPSAGRLRGLLGVQANLWLLRLFVQLNAIPQDPVLASFVFGARAVW